MADKPIYDIIIIGGGPVGLYGLYYAGMRDMKALLIESLPSLGGQLSVYYPEKYIYNIPGHKKILSKDFVRILISQAMQFGREVHLEEKVIDIKRDEGYYIVTTTKESYRTYTILVSIGMGAFIPKKLDIPDIERLEGRGVFYTVRGIDGFRDKDILIVGRGDVAVDWALHLLGIAKRITLINKLDKFVALEANVKRLWSSDVDVRLFHELKQVIGKERVKAAVIYNNKTMEEARLEIDAVLLNTGFLVNLEPLTRWGLELEGNSIKVNYRMETNLEGVYAAGDIASHPGKLKLISTGAGEAAIAISNAKKYVLAKQELKGKKGSATQKG